MEFSWALETSLPLSPLNILSLHPCLLHYEGRLANVSDRLVPDCIIVISELKAFIFKIGWQFTIGKKFLDSLIGHVL